MEQSIKKSKAEKSAPGHVEKKAEKRPGTAKAAKKTTAAKVAPTKAAPTKENAAKKPSKVVKRPKAARPDLQQTLTALGRKLEQAEARAEKAAADGRAHARAKSAAEKKLSRLRQELAASGSAATDGGAAHGTARDAADSTHNDEISQFRKSHARTLEHQMATAKERLEKEFSVRLAQAVLAAEEEADRQLTRAQTEWRSESKRNLAVATARVEQAEISRMKARVQVGQVIQREGRMLFRNGTFAVFLIAVAALYPHLKPVVVEQWDQNAVQSAAPSDPLREQDASSARSR